MMTDTDEMQVEEEKKAGELNEASDIPKPGASSGGSKTRDRTSFQLFFNIKEMSLTLGKLSS